MNNTVRYTIEVVLNSPQEAEVLALAKKGQFLGCQTQYLFEFVDHVVTKSEQQTEKKITNKKA